MKIEIEILYKWTTRLSEIYINYETETDLKHSTTFLKIQKEIETTQDLRVVVAFRKQISWFVCVEREKN